MANVTIFAGRYQLSGGNFGAGVCVPKIPLIYRLQVVDSQCPNLGATMFQKQLILEVPATAASGLRVYQAFEVADEPDLAQATKKPSRS
jgi:hypothetical protein